MGITIHYRGTINDLDRIEEFEDRVIDMALEIGAGVRIWRSTSDHDRSRVVRGLILDVVPGQDTSSLLVSPEGWLVPLVAIEEAENGTLCGPPDCFVKTQYGAIEGHVALVELLSYMQKEFFLDLEVDDEGDYWTSRDLARLSAKFSQVRSITDSLTQSLSEFALSAEAAEDPQIVASRIERVAKLVHATLVRPPEHAPVLFGGDEPSWDDSDESFWDTAYKEDRRKQERLSRALGEQVQPGLDSHDGFMSAMHNAGIVNIDEPNESAFADPEDCREPSEGDFADNQSNNDHDESLDGIGDAADGTDFVEHQRHPLQQTASNLRVRLHRWAEQIPTRTSHHIDTLLGAAGDICGGLAQAMCHTDGARNCHESEIGGLRRGLATVQLKRALRGTAFAVGTLYALRGDGQLTNGDFDDFHHWLKQLRNGITDELRSIREARGGS